MRVMKTPGLEVDRGSSCLSMIYVTMYLVLRGSTHLASGYITFEKIARKIVFIIEIMIKLIAYGHLVNLKRYRED